MEVLDCLSIVKEKYNFQYDFKDQQQEIFSAILNKQHVTGILPTGYGKSDCFTIPQLLMDEIYPDEKPHLGLVISPLRSLMINQCQVWKERGIKAECILKQSEMSGDQTERIINGQCTVVFSSPEAISMDPWRSMLRNIHYKKRLVLLACDEAHCIVQWGDDFREEYRKISFLRSLVTCPILILTATCTEAMRKEILSCLLLTETEVKTIAVTPDRPNIFLTYKSEPSMKYEEELKGFIKDVRENGKHAPKVIIYCRTIKTVAELYEYIVNELGDRSWHDGERGSIEERLVHMYHSSLDPETEKLVLEKFTQKDSHTRCLISTIAFGMGVQVTNVDIIIHWGASKSVLAYWQEVGRCARDGREGKAYLFATKSSLDKRRVDDEMINFCSTISTTNNCIRLLVLQSLVVKDMDTSRIHQLEDRGNCIGELTNGKCTCDFSVCCSNCVKKCKNK
ncbi:ATP-dependent DNA helicase RecQ-like [Glandiceps talaboti]